MISYDCLLYDRLIGRIARLARPSVRLSVCPIRPARNSKTKQRRKIKQKLSRTFTMGRVTLVPIFQFERSMVKVAGRMKTSRIISILMGGSAILRPSLLSAPCATLDERSITISVQTSLV